jgi:hypothetical protein
MRVTPTVPATTGIDTCASFIKGDAMKDNLEITFDAF